MPAVQAFTACHLLLLLAIGNALAWEVGAAASRELAALPGLSRVTGLAEVLEDTQRQWDLAGAIALPATRWLPLDGDCLRLGYSPSAWWLRLRVRNEDDVSRALVLELATPRLDLLDIFLLQGNEILASYRTGDQRLFATRPLLHPHFALPLNLAPKTEARIYLRLDSQSRIFPPLPVRFWDGERFEAIRHQAALGWGLYYGAGLALLAYNLLLFLSTRDRGFGFYAIYLGTFLLLHLGFVSGLGFQSLWPGRPEWNRHFDILLPALLHLPATALVTHFLETRSRLPCWHRWLWRLTAALQGAILTMYGTGLWLGEATGSAIPWFVQIFIILNILLVLLYLLAGVRVWRQGLAAAGYLVLAWSCLILGILVHHLIRLPGLLPANFLTENSLTIGSTLEFLLLAMALGERFNRLKEANLVVERRAHALRLAYAADLEQQVEERTQALRAAISQSQNALEAERLAREEQREFLATISHEWRTPVAVIDNIAQNLEMEAEERADPNRQRYVRILQATQRLTRLLDDHLTEERFSLLRLELRRTPCNPSELLEEAAAATRLLSERHIIRVEVYLTGLPTRFACDRELIGLVLRSLADNAIKYTPEGSIIRLYAAPAGQRASDGLWLEVADNGPGLKPEEVESLFDPYFRGTTAQGQPGKGLGLTLARRLIQTQGGTLTAVCVPEQGCRFRIWLPGPRPALQSR
ncbi:sensor histidine kinase [uncultured Thiocystis sp.]|jgi:signal transduction histidine kinase|uniref:sensor histidine kinase n=1 Tax=uncultured Thiocystis sp. TaxID=1202134 RepID=UPI0025E87543|nr:sensor histidine kinase [uncultured Thiocystis sp.]